MTRPAKQPAVCPAGRPGAAPPETPPPVLRPRPHQTTVIAPSEQTTDAEHVPSKNVQPTASDDPTPTVNRPLLKNMPKTQSLDLRQHDVVHLKAGQLPNKCGESSASSSSIMTREMRSRLLVSQQSRSLGGEESGVGMEGTRSPGGSPRTVRRRQPLRESRRVSIDASGSYFQLNQYKLLDPIGQVSYLHNFNFLRHLPTWTYLHIFNDHTLYIAVYLIIIYFLLFLNNF